MGDIKMVVGLGNPGTQYQFTRHNIGFRILEAFATRNIIPEIKWKKKLLTQMIQSHLKEQKIILSNPMWNG